MAEVYEVKITTQAQEQMEEIVDYISHELFAPDAANNLLDKMEKSIYALSEFPEHYQLIEEEPWRTEGIRKIVVNNFLIYYWVDKVNRKVQITAVIYEKRDQIAQLKKMSLEI
ncbi:MAG: type II toxin-antitoxin system RelE/ParE family toxin [Roseburia sp.]